MKLLGPDLAHLLEPMTTSTPQIADKWAFACRVPNAQASTVVPMGQTFSLFFLPLRPGQRRGVPKTLKSSSSFSKKLPRPTARSSSAIRGMSMNNTGQLVFWSCGATIGDVLLPAYERDKQKLARNGWKSGLTEPCMQQPPNIGWGRESNPTISCRAVMPAYDRNEANAVFHVPAMPPSPSRTRCGGASSAIASKSKVAGRVAAARFPLDPTAPGFAWERYLGLGDPQVRSASGAHEGRQADAAGDDAPTRKADKLWKRPLRRRPHHFLAEESREPIRS